MFHHSVSSENGLLNGHVPVGSCGGPTVPLVPAPWKLKGNGLILLTRTPATQLQADQALPDTVRESLKAPLSVVMLVNYQQSDCGPYQELLFIPGTVAIAGKRMPTISNIYVSSEASVVNGRLNWGIPKERAQFKWDASSSGERRIEVALDNQTFFEVAYESSGLQLPVNTGWVPSPFKTLGQLWDGKTFIFSPSAMGRARRAKIRHLHVAPGAFPMISAQHVVAAFEIPSFDMEFPVPQIL